MRIVAGQGREEEGHGGQHPRPQPGGLRSQERRDDVPRRVRVDHARALPHLGRARRHQMRPMPRNLLRGSGCSLQFKPLQVGLFINKHETIYIRKGI